MAASSSTPPSTPSSGSSSSSSSSSSTPGEIRHEPNVHVIEIPERLQQSLGYLYDEPSVMFPFDLIDRLREVPKGTTKGMELFKTALGGRAGQHVQTQSQPRRQFPEKPGRTFALLNSVAIKDIPPSPRRGVRLPAQRLEQFLRGAPFDAPVTQLRIWDARWPFEYVGGHIESTRPDILIENFPEGYKLQEVYERFWEPVSKQPRFAPDIAHIFHCEFSQWRGPRLYSQVMFLDEVVNYPSKNRHYPEIYVLAGGYEAYVNLPPAVPVSYVRENGNFSESERYTQASEDWHEKYPGDTVPFVGQTSLTSLKIPIDFNIPVVPKRSIRSRQFRMKPMKALDFGEQSEPKRQRDTRGPTRPLSFDLFGSPTTLSGDRPSTRSNLFSDLSPPTTSTPKWDLTPIPMEGLDIKDVPPSSISSDDESSKFVLFGTTPKKP